MTRLMPAILLLGALSCFSQSALAFEYEAIDLGDLGGYGHSEAEAINALGQITGVSNNASSENHAYLWKNGFMTDLGSLKEYSIGYDINDTGQIVGYVDNTAGEYHAARWDNIGGWQDLGVLGGNQSSAFGINNSGQVVGRSNIADDALYKHAFIWNSGTGMEDLGTLGGDNSAAFAVNNTGQVAGEAQLDTGSQHAFLWDSTNGMQDIGTLSGYDDASAWAINDSGQVVGVSGGKRQTRAFLWDEVNGMMDLGSLNDQSSSANDINNLGYVVGDSSSDDSIYYTRAIIWDKTHGMRNLNDLIPDSFQWTLLTATGINDNGWITAFGEYFDGMTVQHHGILLKPLSAAAVPEPSALLFLGGGLLAAFFRSRRRSVLES